MPADGARQDDFFDVAALLNQIVDRVAVVDADHILFDDGAIVEHLSNVVSGGADQLDAALKRLVVGLGTHERRQERVVNINEVLGGQGGDELIRQHLHVACEDDETAFVLADERNLLLFRFPLVFFSDRYDEVGDAVEVGDTLVIGMIGNDQRDFAAKFATLVAVKKVLQAMVILRDEDGDAGAFGGVSEPPFHLEVAGDGSKAFGKVGKVKIKICRIELNPRQKEIGFLVSMLIGEQDVAVVAEDEFGNRGDDPFAVGAGDQEDGGVMHKRL